MSSGEPGRQGGCGRCGGVLEASELSGVAFQSCASCHGMLVEQPRFVKLLEALTETLGEYISMEGVIPAIADSGVPVSCPRCAGKMTRFGYMETRTVMLDRCGKCWVLWVDPEELQSAVMMHARVTRRAEARQTELIALAEHLTRLTVIRRGGP